MLTLFSFRNSGNIEIDELFLRRELGLVDRSDYLEMNAELFTLHRYDSAKLASFASCKFSELQEDLYIPQVSGATFSSLGKPC